MSDVIKIDPGILPKAKEIFSIVSQQRPEHSLSFILSAEGSKAVSDTLKIIDWGIGGNKPKIKSTAQEVIGEFSETPSGVPVNINLTEYELKAMQEVLMAIEKAMESHEDGILA